ncbi:sugar phosphate nucleotidyltransferase [Tistrella bauzanensis]
MTTSDLSGHSGLSGSATADHSKPAAGRPGSGGMPASAMVLAAGLGTRMRPLSDDRPKPLVEVAGRPLIDWTLDRLVEVGVPRIVVNTHHHAARLSAHLAGLRAELATRSGVRSNCWKATRTRCSKPAAVSRRRCRCWATRRSLCPIPTRSC